MLGTEIAANSEQGNQIGAAFWFVHWSATAKNKRLMAYTGRQSLASMASTVLECKTLKIMSPTRDLSLTAF
jgi:hypothetical protein